MSMKYPSNTESALNLTLNGSVGKFQISPEASGGKSLEVLYLMTHIGFDTNVSSNEAMLRHLAPVREVFDFDQLQFEELMQRDIDDARVSTELIPYLLDAGACNTIKFFPPIVVVVLPVKKHAINPDVLYPEITRYLIDKDPDTEAPTDIIRSGEIGAEAFQFQYPHPVGRPADLHSFAKLKLNMNKVRLVIIDGQHRAMALLALHRNMKDDWSDAKRTPFKEYYSEWTSSKILNFNLDNIQLPIIVCTYPDLDSNYKGDFDVIKAARSTFLTLNKNARKVSKSRNILLDDSDLISHFLRYTLSQIKKNDTNSINFFRIWNIELDQNNDRIKIASPIACTGLMHFYYAIEHMMLSEGNDVKGLKTRTGKFYKRVNVASLLRRLDGENLLGHNTAKSLKRTTYTTISANALSKSFYDEYGSYLEKSFNIFEPYKFHNNATLETRSSLQGVTNPAIKNILYEGQNFGTTFTEYLSYMTEREHSAKSSGNTLPPEILVSLTKLQGTKRSVDENVKNIEKSRTNSFINKIINNNSLKTKDGEDVADNLIKLINSLYDNVFKTIAFQTALVCGYFLIFEKAECEAREQSLSVPNKQKSFKEYIDSLNNYFVPKTIPYLKNLISAFFYDIDGDCAVDWKIVETNTTFRSVVYTNEMKPDEWPKYFYIILELWHSKDPVIEKVKKTERDLCRSQAFKSLHIQNIGLTAKNLEKAEQNLTPADKEDIFNRTFEKYNAFLHNLRVAKKEQLTKTEAKAAIDIPQSDKEDILEDIQED